MGKKCCFIFPFQFSFEFIFKIILFSCLFLSLSGCIHSAVTREAECQMDRGYINVGNQYYSNANPDPVAAYEKSNNMTKGFVLGGAAGALGLTTSLGLVPGTAVGAIIGGAFGAYLDYYSTTIDRLKDRGVKVFILGDQVKFIIPSTQLFYCNTAELYSDAQCTLDLIIYVINGIPNMSVHIAAYIPDSWPKCIALSFTKQQAQTILRYMWRRCVNTRLLTANGYGGCNLVDINSANWNCGENYRIEISLERVPV